MKICFMCDLHLPSDKNALQYDVLRWAIEDILQKNPDCIAYAGDVTCDGNEAVYDFFTDKMNSLNIPFLYIPGNSDLRCDKSKDSIYHKASQCKNVVDGVEIYVVNDCNNDIEQSVFEIIENAGLLEKIGSELTESAKLRLEHHSASLSELASMHEPPITKSTLNNRFEKIMKMAENIAKKGS